MSNSPFTLLSSSTPSGSLNEANMELSITKATSSSKKASDLLESKRLSEGIPTWNPDEEAKLKQLLTARKKALVSLGLGDSENHLEMLDDSDLTDSSHGSGTGQPSGPSRSKTFKRSRAFVQHSSKSQPGSSHGSGAKSAASTSVAKPELANPRSSTTPSGTRMFTLYQASRLCGSTGTLANASSSLMSLKARLAEKHSFESWMGILTMAQSKAVSSALNGLLSFFAATQTSSLASIPLSDGGSSEEDSFVSSDNEEILGDSHSLHSSEELSAEEEEYRYAKRIRRQAEEAWANTSPTSSQNEFSHSDSGW